MRAKIDEHVFGLTFDPTRRFTVAVVAPYRISQLAERVGVPATTLRYYESQGLLPAQRTASGYRSYDDHDVERIRFIGTAKDLGIPLARIRDLLEVWQDGMCRDVRSRLLPLVAHQITALDGRMADLIALRRHLTDAQQRLQALPARDASCDPECLFLAGPPPEPPGTTPTDQVVSIACSLSGDDHATRLATWHHALTGTAPHRLADGSVQVDIPSSRVAALAALIVDEATCCPFFRFTLAVTHAGARLQVSAPPEADSLLDDLFPAHPTERNQC